MLYYKDILKSTLIEAKLSKSEKNTLKIIEGDFKSWAKSLSSEEKHAIKKYTKNSFDNSTNKFYMRLNRMLESEYPYCVKGYKVLNRYSDLISNALKKYETKRDMVCYRGVNISPFSNIKIGDTFEYKSFVSTSLFKKKAFCCEYLLIIHIPKKTHACYIGNISHYRNQYEVLIDKGYQYKLLSVKRNIFELEVCVDD